MHAKDFKPDRAVKVIGVGYWNGKSGVVVFDDLQDSPVGFGHMVLVEIRATEKGALRRVRFWPSELRFL